ncbi:T9SS type A sorting domain-containing protein [Aquimarina sp. 2201CG14-23]|uniref:T9SS type A sorting domain-containing protein n=1 Tax=Aquimarina mycalae TaxID=3040073 RepID=UPI0024781D53|nr:T9SS type A sorting domain-containing protein [Aquimarina sp. 2201CG14-23]MDH7448306.1 T9SS type A sorting domain-containing protein [Aquimarina sp. 2201CG14-23]
MTRITTLCLLAVVSICLISSKSLNNNLLNNTTTIISIEDDGIDKSKKSILSSTTVDLPSGSIIIDMGVASPNFKNGLKPYGLIYAIIKEHDTPVLWSINPNKSKDGVDFNVDGKDFKGGPFAISKEYLTAAVLDEINNWKSQGVITHQTLSDVTIPVYQELTFYPTWVLDKKNGKIAEKYLKNAGIPKSAYTTALPKTLNECHDLFVLPHAEPTWKDHGPLLAWNSPISEGGYQGYIWSGCTAVSNLENLYNPDNPSQQLNFLSLKSEIATDNGDDYFENALVLADNHEDASNTTHNIDFPVDPFMQFIGQSDGVHKGGKEEIYLPVNGGGWRASTKVGIWDTNQEDLGTLSTGKAALMLYGPAYGDANRGQIMYQAGHDLNKDGTTAERVAAQRGFLNFSFDAPSAKVPEIIMNNPEQREVTLTNGESIVFDITGIPVLGGDITYEWSTSCSIGSFDNPTSPTPTFTVPSTPVIQENETCIVTVKAMDECGRLSFLTYIVNFVDEPEPCTIASITASNSSSCNDNGTSTPEDDFFTADITVSFTSPPVTGFLQLTGDTMADIHVSVNELDSDTSHTFVGVQLPANGNSINLKAFFSIDGQVEDATCVFNGNDVITAPTPCSFTPTPCNIIAVYASNNTLCDDNGTDTPTDNFFTVDITVLFTSVPETGFLVLAGDQLNETVAVNELDNDTSHTFTAIQLPADGESVSLQAFFILDINEPDVVECSFTNVSVITAPICCTIEDDGCNIDSIVASNIACSGTDSKMNENQSFFKADITVSFSSAPTTGILKITGDATRSVDVSQLDSNTSHTFINVQFPADGRIIDLTAFFDGAEGIECAYNDTAVTTAPLSCNEGTPTSIENKISFKDVTIYPNPSKGNITIETPYVSGEVRVQVIDFTGKIIMTKNTNPKGKNIELYDLPQGIFLVKLQARNNSMVRKVIIEQ